MRTFRFPLKPLLLAGVAMGTLTACEQPFDWDLRDLGGNTLDTSTAARNLPDRPRPDDRGVISYPGYQVVAARQGETVRMIATRLNLSAEELARYNGVDADVALRRDEIIALPTRVTEPSPATGAATTGPIQPSSVDVTTLASNAIDRAGPQATAPSASQPVSEQAPAPQTGEQPIRHQVRRGETVYSISRSYGIPVRNIAEWNGLGADLAIREGQFLLIPQGGAPAPAAATSAPGAGSAAPTPPSAATALPPVNATPAAPVTAPAPEAPNLSTGSAQSGDGVLIYPVRGSVIREYARGRNEGIDIGVPAGTEVKAAAAGTVAAVTRDTNGVAIVVIRHANNLLTVYTNLDNLTVEKDDRVSQGQTIGKVRAGNPSFLHFEVREGLESVNPANYLN
ncbi:LysM peptidoglycan-binding domain-containing protein [Loktanella sp. IMCC34160]|uniref:M23 family metallopeptidase n=1 Tax=Loktanella sp. IMCC34160 TaxID=2510646 RepID=UPI00101CCABC|nr:M23 family metallopeptidase [Loktanella sp. IMCC34160]RYG92855.1 LysM peptidoglycan-binding domain-containing protein [Loktanella sp. IMCC34160]